MSHSSAFASYMCDIAQPGWFCVACMLPGSVKFNAGICTDHP